MRFWISVACEDRPARAAWMAFLAAETSMEGMLEVVACAMAAAGDRCGDGRTAGAGSDPVAAAVVSGRGRGIGTPDFGAASATGPKPTTAASVSAVSDP